MDTKPKGISRAVVNRQELLERAGVKRKERFDKMPNSLYVKRRRPVIELKSGGSTEDRPKEPEKDALYFDTTLQAVIWHDGEKWLDLENKEV